jgi:putative DNA primase/helicase
MIRTDIQMTMQVSDAASSAAIGAVAVDIFDPFEDEAPEPAPEPATATAQAATSDREIEFNDDIPNTESGNAERLIEAYGDVIRYCVDHKCWYVWTGKFWQPNADLEIITLMKNVAREMALRAIDCDDEGTRRTKVAWAMRSQSRHVIDNSISLARPLAKIESKIFDQNLYALNLGNGTLNLKTGELKKHDPLDYNAKISPVVYDPNAKCPLWEKFMAEAVPNENIRNFLQRFAGYTLTGFTGEHCFLMPYGPGRNGKGTMLKLMACILADYAQYADWQSFTLNRNGGFQIRNDIARMQGARMVCAMEGEQNQRIAESLIKTLTGGDKIAARFLHREYVEFEPQCKFWLATNHKPRIIGTDHAIWSRIHVIPFNVKFDQPPYKIDVELAEKLKAESSGILNWMVQGLQGYKKDGLAVPQEVKDETTAWRQSSDTIGTFLNETTVKKAEGYVLQADIYDKFRSWCDKTGAYKMPLKDFKTAMGEHNYEPKKMNTGMVWKGLVFSAGDIENQPQVARGKVDW